MTTQAIRSMLLGLALALVGASCAVQPNPVPVPAPATAETAQSSGYIVQAASVEQAAAAVEAVGGEVTHELGIIRAVGALLSPLQAAMLRERTDVRRVFEDATVRTSSACGVSTGTTRWKTTSFTDGEERRIVQGDHRSVVHRMAEREFDAEKGEVRRR